MQDQITAQTLPMSPREQKLLAQLEEIKQICLELSSILSAQDKVIATQGQELAQLRRSMIELKEENSHLREVLQTWRERMDSVLSQLRGLN
ncbi:MAG: hypothetical protein IAA31_02765 [Candidatus Anaerobiospirillum merdipullorum]|uniref:Cell division protein ZapB n=1 Tax=Candidatus Anaerobiospirillum merdipullorum TaxID=2838450 RepID=A0A9E2KN34_9GAMM|nr:hypothetical protein [Candidatus Anaerobiospirillum merdipullorum]